MTTLRKAAQQALEALEQVAEYFNVDSTEAKAIASLRERLAQPDPVPYWHSEFLKHNTTSEQPARQQEPVAQEWRYYFSHSGATGKPDEVVGPCFTDRKEVAFGVGCFDQTALYPPASKPLTMQERTSIVRANTSFHDKNGIDAYGIIDDVEAAHGITREQK